MPYYDAGDGVQRGGRMGPDSFQSGDSKPTANDSGERNSAQDVRAARLREQRESLHEIAALVAAAWKRIEPRICGNSDELMARLARRRGGMLNRPPRAWCAAVRAGDTRISPASAIVQPVDVLGDYADNPGSWLEHSVVLDAPLVRRLCRAVWCDRPY